MIYTKIYDLYQSNPKGFIIVLNAVSSDCEENFQVEGTPLRTGLHPDWIHCMMMPGNRFVMLIWLVKDDENRFLDDDTGTGCRIQMILGHVVGYDFDECGRFSISSWVIVA